MKTLVFIFGFLGYNFAEMLDVNTLALQNSITQHDIISTLTTAASVVLAVAILVFIIKKLKVLIVSLYVYKQLDRY